MQWLITCRVCPITGLLLLRRQLASKAITHFLFEFEANGNGSSRCRFSLWRIFNPENAVGNECSDNSLRCAAYVGTNLFAQNSMIVRMNSHLQIPQLRFSGLQRASTFFQVTMLVFRYGQEMICLRQPIKFSKAGKHLMFRKIKRIK